METRPDKRFGRVLGLGLGQREKVSLPDKERGCPAWLKGAPDARPPPQAEPCGAGGRLRHQGMVNLHSMVKLQPFSPVFRFSAGGFHGWILSAAVPLELQGINHQPFSVARPFYKAVS